MWNIFVCLSVYSCAGRVEASVLILSWLQGQDSGLVCVCVCVCLCVCEREREQSR